MNTEKHIKDKLGNYDSPMQMDRVWSQLEQKLDGVSSQRKSTSFFRRFLPFLSLMIFGSLIGYVALSDGDQNDVDSVAAKLGITESNIPATNQGVFSALGNKKLKTKTDQPTNTNASAEPNSNSSTSSKIKIDELTLETSTATQSKELHQQKSKIFSNSKTPTTGKVSAASKVIQKKIIKKKTIAPTKAPVQAPIAEAIKLDQAKDKLNQLPLSMTAAQPISEERILPKANQPIVPSITPQGKKSQWRLGLALGGNRSAFNYSIPGIKNDDWVKDKRGLGNAYVTNHWGVSLEKIFESGFKVATGFHHLDHGLRSSQTDTTLLSQTIESETTNYVYINDTPALVTETVFINNYGTEYNSDRHRLSSFQIPILLGYEISKGPWDMSASVGVGINYFHDQTRNWPNTIETERGILKNVYDEGAASNRVMASGLMEAQFGLKMGKAMRFYIKVDGGIIFNNLYDNQSQYILEEQPNSEIYQVSTRLNHRGLKMGVSYSI